MEGGCHHSGQLFTAVHSEISQAQVRPAELLQADKLTSVPALNTLTVQDLKMHVWAVQFERIRYVVSSADRLLN